MMMEMRELSSFSKEYVDSLDVLMRELSPQAAATEDRVRKCIEDKTMHLYAAFEHQACRSQRTVSGNGV